MKLPLFSAVYESWAATVARIIFGLVFLMSASFKIPGTESFAMQVEMSAGVGIPFPYIAVVLALILEVVAGIALVIGYHTRIAALLLAGFVMLIALFFYRDLSDQATFGLFMSCLTESAALIYISVYGAQYAAVKKDPLPQGLTRS
jgi:putative oxidoreductase